MSQSHATIGGAPAWVVMTEPARIMSHSVTTDHDAAQSNSLTVAIPSPNLSDKTDAWRRHRRIWRGVASIIHRNNAKR